MISMQHRLALGRRRRWRLLAALALPWACTLTQQDFEPNEVSRLDTTPSADAGAPGMPGGCPQGERCCSTTADCVVGETCSGGQCTLACSITEDLSACELALCPGPSCPGEVASCDDGVQNGREPAPDCGASCPTPCPVGSACSLDLDCASERCDGTSCVEATCEDGERNRDETAVDCGGSCPSPCPTGSACTADADCGAGLVCATATQLCTAASCQDGTQNGGETLVDCGGGGCPGCPPGSPCAGEDDCDSRVCSQGQCARAACPDGIANGGESGIDCGGADAACPRCSDGQPCAGAPDCSSERCEDGRCVSCTDGERNGTETGADCGGGGCPRCEGGEGCGVDDDCVDGDCSAGACVAARCDDGIRNGSEAGTDCGGASSGCERCGDGATCATGADCTSQRCAAGRCVSCGDGVRNGTESDTDCGGTDASCDRCASGAACQADSDCGSGACVDGACCGGALADCTRCALRLSPSVDCDFPSAGVDSTGVLNCNAFLACLADNAERCPTRNAPGCSGDNQAADACPHNDYGGNAGTGLTRANQVLTNAGCQL